MLETLPPPCAVVMKSGNLNFLEPSGSFQACTGTALPSYTYANLLYIYHYIEIQEQAIFFQENIFQINQM